MTQKNSNVHPYIPNSAPANKEKILQELGIKDIDELYEDIPERLRFRRELNIPPAMASLARKISVFWVQDAPIIMSLLFVMR